MRALLALLFLSGCATNGDSRLITHHDHTGTLVEVLELHQECPKAVTKEPNAGCAIPRPVRVIFYPKFDEHARQHELDHVAGMRHGHWVNQCALIVASGYTQWIAGNVMCRRNTGDYYQRAQ